MVFKPAQASLPTGQKTQLTLKLCKKRGFRITFSIQNGQPKVTDFGLAKQLNVDSGLAGAGQILGTPSYMAPEQASGKVNEVGPLADVYAHQSAKMQRALRRGNDVF